MSLAVTLIKLPFRTARVVWRGLRRLRPGSAPAASPDGPPLTTVAAEARPPAPPVTPVEVRVEETPNPEARKFVCAVEVVPKGSLVLHTADDARGHAFAEAVFALGGIRTLFATKDFVTVTRKADGPPWSALEPAVVDALGAALAR